MKLPEKGFPFNCGFDICRFPEQYCDDDEKRCSYCTEDVCNSGTIPEQCVPKCTSLTSSTTPLTAAVDKISKLNTAPSPTWLYVISVTALILVLILYAHKTYRLCRKSCKARMAITQNMYRLLRYKPNNDRGINVPNDDNGVVPNGRDIRDVIAPENTNEPTAPPKSGHFCSKPVNEDSGIVTSPENNSGSSCDNLGEYNILPSHSEELHQNEVSVDKGNSNISQPLNEDGGEKMDHNILDSSKEYRSGIQDTTEHSKDYMSERNEQIFVTDETREITIAKEKTVRPDKLCLRSEHKFA